MRRMGVTLALLATGALGVAGVAAASAGSASSGTAHAADPVKLTIWVGWSQRELSVFKKVVAEYDQKHPEVTVSLVGGINDNKIVSAIRAGNAPDIVSSFNSYNVGTYCGSGAWVDLGPLLQKDHIDPNSFPAATRYYTQYGGKRCALPLLADTYGLYYNKKLFKAAGISRPPHTISELTTDLKKLTKRDGSGNIKVAGFDPFVGFYENVPERWVASYGAKWLDSSNKSTISKDSGWSKWLKWQKSVIDWYGYDKLVKFQAGLGDEFSASQAFEVGKLAMAMDGEWRVAFIAAEHPELDYGTAPMPVDDAHPELYGQGYINGTIIGMPKGGKNQDQAWALVKYLTTADHPLAQLSNGLRNVPTTRSSLSSKEIKPDPHFAPFLKIFANAHSTTSPITASGVAYTNLVQNFATKWQAGKVSDLPKSLSDLDKQLDAQVKQAGGGGGGVP
jgi:multiple sugar transport system substrate-binding protein